MSHVLFISRKYPPIIGGMENYAYHLHNEFKKNQKVYSILLKKRQFHLIWFYPWAFFYGTFLVLVKKIKLVYIGDGVLSSLAFYFERILKIKTVITIHGLDVIYDRFGYQKMIGFFLPKLRRIVANSHATQSEAIKRGVLESHCHVIPVGVDLSTVKIKDKNHARSIISKLINKDLQTKTVLFTIGRLVKRKGVLWFLENVMPTLPEHHVLIIAGDGPDFEAISQATERLDLNQRVYLLGRVSEDSKSDLFSMCDIFISPNIKTEGDMEGFGIVNLEAGAYGVPVIGTRTDGVVDAVKDGETGYLVEERNAVAMKKAILNAQSLQKDLIINLIEKEYSWESIYKQYKLKFMVE